jgi:hypothetical protein
VFYRSLDVRLSHIHIVVARKARFRRKNSKEHGISSKVGHCTSTLKSRELLGKVLMHSLLSARRNKNFAKSQPPAALVRA